MQSTIDKELLKGIATAVSGTFTDSDITTKSENDWVPIAKVGQPMQITGDNSSDTPEEVFTTAEGFKLSVKLFNDIGLAGYVSTNHAAINKGLNMLEQKFKDPFLYAKFNTEGEKAIRNPKLNGRSIDATIFAFDGTQATHFLVPGVSMLDGEHKPACTPQMGCASVSEKRLSNPKVDFDIVVLNNRGELVKVRDVNLYLDKGEMKDEKILKDQLLAEVAYLGQRQSCSFYKHDSKLKIGDVIPEGVKALHTIQIAISEKKEVESEYHEGGDNQDMGEEGKGEAVTYTGEQTKEMMATAVSEATEKLGNAHAVELTKLKDEGEAKAKEAEEAHEKAIVVAQEEAFKRAQARATFMQKFSLKDDSELVKKYDAVKTVMDMQTLVNSMDIPTAVPAAAGISSAKSEGDKPQVEKIEEIGNYDPIKGEYIPSYREEVKG